MTDKQRIELDKDAIYLGNIFTVEADLDLPDAGKHGSVICWESSQPNIIAPTGKINRPHAGSGNRKVVLTATLHLGQQRAVRHFDATVLQLENNFSIHRVEDTTLYTDHLENSGLPEVVVVANKAGQFSVAPVQWAPLPKLPLTGSAIIKGVVEGTSLPAKATILSGKAQDTAPREKLVEDLPPTDIILTSGIFYENQQRALQHLMQEDCDRLLYNFREASGLSTQGASPMIGWDAPECKLKGHTTGHFLSALALASVSCPDTKEVFQQKIEYMVSTLAACQESFFTHKKYSFGFLSAYSEEQFNLLEQFVPYPQIWAPYYTLHKIMAGLLDCYQLAHNQTALEVCEKIGIWIYNRLSKLTPQQLAQMWAMYIAGEYGGINESLASLYRITGNPQFLDAALYFNNPKLFVPMEQNYDTLGGMHANQHIPQIIGAMELFEVTGNPHYYTIAHNFWKHVTTSHCYSIGGVGEGEMFRPAREISPYITEKTAESCASYNMLKLTKKLYAYQPNPGYMNYYERTLYNHIAPSQDQSGPLGGSTYFMPLSPGGNKEFDYEENSCCHGTGLENHVKYQSAIYAISPKGLYVNLYIPSICSHSSLYITQTGDLLLDQKSTLRFENATALPLHLRIPEWAENDACILLNGQILEEKPQPGTYYSVHRQWKEGDEITVILPFHFRLEATLDSPNIVSVLYGPLVMVAQHESKEYLRLNLSNVHDIDHCWKKTDAPLTFEHNGIPFIPNYFANTCPYHAYFTI